MPNIDVSADILEFMQVADYAAARALLQESVPYFGKIATKTGVDATVATTPVYGDFEAGLTTSNTRPLFLIVRYNSGTFAVPTVVSVVSNGGVVTTNFDMQYLAATNTIVLQPAFPAYYGAELGAANGWGTYLATAQGGAATFNFEVWGIIYP